MFPDPYPAPAAEGLFTYFTVTNYGPLDGGISVSAIDLNLQAPYFNAIMNFSLENDPALKTFLATYPSNVIALTNQEASSVTITTEEFLINSSNEEANTRLRAEFTATFDAAVLERTQSGQSETPISFLYYNYDDSTGEDV